MGQPMNATFGSVVFCHLLHSGGTTLRQLFSQQLCDDGYGLRCWEGRGRGIPAPAEARRPLDALYGHFPFQPAKFAKVTVNPFYLTVLADPWDVLRSGYFHMKLRKDERRRIFRLDAKVPAPEAWARETFPEGLAAHLERLAGVDPGVWVTGTYACDAALANLPRFHFLTEKDLLHVEAEAAERADGRRGRGAHVDGVDDRRAAALEEERGVVDERALEGAARAVGLVRRRVVVAGDRAEVDRDLCANQIFNPTSMCAYSNVLTRALPPCFENSLRAIDSSKNQPNRLRFDRAREFSRLAPTSQLTG
jgi:hypothetical protein